MELPATAAFASFEDHAWLNCAQQGPLPLAAADAARAAVAAKTQPYRMGEEAFATGPPALKARLARLIGADAAHIVLGNSASYGLQMIANGMDWRPSEEVLLLRGDFPASTLPWHVLRRQGVAMRWLEPRGPAPNAEELDAAIRPATRLFCASWVNSFTGAALDLAALGAVCRRRGVWFVLNAAQALGALPLDVGQQWPGPVDALSCCGYKWLCGPYGTGFAWIAPPLLARLHAPQINWFAAQHGAGLNHMRDLAAPGDGLGAAGFDVFNTANFFNFAPWAAALDLLLACGPEAIAAYDQRLVAQLRAQLDGGAYRPLTPAAAQPSPILVLSHRDPGRNPAIHAALAAAGVDISLREGNLRFSPHFYNTPEEISRAVAALERLS